MRVLWRPVIPSWVMSRRLAVAIAVFTLTGCASNPDQSCVTRTDCDEAEICVNGTCQPASVDASVGEDAAAEDTGATLCGEACETELPCEIGVYDCSEGQPVCIRSGLHEQGFVCREASNSCDLDDTCDGVSAGCANDATAIGTPCDGGFCDGRGECGACQQGVACNPDPCQEGTIACSDAGVPSCEATGNVPDETSCGEVVIGGYSACEWDDDACAETGERSREIQEGLCIDGTCTVRSRMETMPCSRDREGTSCGDTREGAWSACGYSSTCDESAERTRTITARRCQSASCVDVPTNEQEDCTRDTDGMSCGDPTPGPAGACMFTGECAVGGMRSRQIQHTSVRRWFVLAGDIHGHGGLHARRHDGRPLRNADLWPMGRLYLLRLRPHERDALSIGDLRLHRRPDL